MEVPDDMLTRYFERRRRDLEDCVESYNKKKFRELEKVGHQLKGNGHTFGYPELSRIGQQLEEAAMEKNIMQIEGVLRDFSLWVNTRS